MNTATSPAHHTWPMPAEHAGGDETQNVMRIRPRAHIHRNLHLQTVPVMPKADSVTQSILCDTFMTAYRGAIGTELVQRYAWIVTRTPTSRARPTLCQKTERNTVPASGLSG